MSDEILKHLGPLASLAGTWEGDKGIDVSRIHNKETETKFREEVGYWLWDKDRKQLLRCFMVPRGVLVNAGGDAEADSKRFHLSAEVGSETYGILSNKYLDESYKTKKYILDVTIHDDGKFSYQKDTQLWIPINQAICHHTDQNTLKKV